MKKLSLSIVLICTSVFFLSCDTSGKSEKETSTREAPSQQETSNDQKQTTGDQAPTTETSKNTKEAETAATTESSESNEPFDYLEEVTVFDTDYMTTQVMYNASVSQIFNQKVSELPEDDPFHYSDGGPGMGNVKILKTKIAPSGPDYYVIFSPGPSADPTFIFYKEGSLDQAVFSVMALKIYIPGNGNIYAEGHTNNTFNKRRKFTLSNGEFVEVEQPFYYVGLKTQTLKPVKLYKSKNLSQVIANLPANYSIEVLVNNPENSSMFLVKTDFGLTGWLEIPGEFMFCGRGMIEGIYMAGD